MMLRESLQATILSVLYVLIALGTPAATLGAQADSLSASLNRPGVFLSELSPCPAPCESYNPQDWTVYNSFHRLSFCDKPILFNFAIHTPVNDPSKTLAFRSCTAGDNFDGMSKPMVIEDSEYDSNAISKSEATLQFTQQSRDASRKGSSENVLIAISQVQRYLEAGSDCSKNIILGYHKGAVAGVYAGQALGKRTTSSVTDLLVSKIKGELQATTLAQLCGDERDASHTFGAAASADGDLEALQRALSSWSKGECVKNFGDTSSLQDINVWEVPRHDHASNSPTEEPNQPKSPRLVARANDYCDTRKVRAGDTCQSLAKACGILEKEFYKYNSKDMCKNLQIDSKVCCTAGSLRPQPYDNGTCYTYTTQPDDTCYDIGKSNSLTQKEIAKFNDGTTWGWNGCDNLGVGQNICLSPGDPPLPAVLPNAICGPQVPGASFNGPVTNSSDLASLNPCPLNSCCNIWGQCGIDSSFCTKAKGPTGNPGTSKPGVNGCISNCGTDIVNNDKGPSDGYKRVGYYETYNWDRKCLHMSAKSSNTLGYTHMHWAFGSIGEDLSIHVNDSHGQWEGFMQLKDTKRIVSFGGWGFSTEVATYNILRKAMEPDHRDKFVSNLVSFAKEKGIDGIDIDWEYPGAPDIPGIPPGLDSDAPNYLATLKALRKKLPDEYSLSIAAPASYWYLKAFPIGKMSKVVDYIVFMAYDMHGQYDYGNSYSQSGCEKGNCLRSHVNQTEVELALSMVTKAGANANKIMVGETSYGRSFKMAEAGCTGPQCFFTGTNNTSNAKPGRCTGTGGILANAEIKEIISKGGDSVQTWHDKKTGSDYMVYDKLQWVAYMNYKTKQERRKKWKNLNFLGTIDWAVDLQDFNPGDSDGSSGGNNSSSCVNIFDDMIWSWANPVIDAPVNCTNLIQASPLPTTVTRTAHSTVTLISGTSLSITVVSTAFPISEVNYQPFTIAPSDVESGSVLTYKPVPRVTPDPMQIQVPSGWSITSTGGPAGDSSPTSDQSGSSTTTPTTTTDAGTGLVYITWKPTVSYSLPSFVSPKMPAPTELPDDDDSPSPTPDPGVEDCKGDGCSEGQDCNNGDCTRGGDCTGPGCTRGGNCEGPSCIRGGLCSGENCVEGGLCKGNKCVQGGGCAGPQCNSGGGCSGPNCSRGGGCIKTIFSNCSPGGCTGASCIDTDCVGPWCDNQITISVPPASPPPTPKPTCLTNCPTLPPTSGGNNQPCNINKCPPDNMPTDKGCTSFKTANACTEIVSRTAVQTSPQTSYSTTTRTHCEKTIDCDAQDTTRTTTITTSNAADPTASVKVIYEYENTSVNQDLLAAATSYYKEFESQDGASSTSTTDIPTSTLVLTTTIPPPPITVTVTPTPDADCAFWDQGWGRSYEIYNIENWAEDGGKSLHDEINGCGAVTGWDWRKATDDSYAKVYFNLPYTMRDGCVARAIGSAGGPKIDECTGSGWGSLSAQNVAQDQSVSIGKQKEGPVVDESLVDKMISHPAYSPKPSAVSHASSSTSTAAVTASTGSRPML